jgi:hypothetical protein
MYQIMTRERVSMLGSFEVMSPGIAGPISERNMSLL